MKHLVERIPRISEHVRAHQRGYEQALKELDEELQALQKSALQGKTPGTFGEGFAEGMHSSFGIARRRLSKMRAAQSQHAEVFIDLPAEVRS